MTYTTKQGDCWDAIALKTLGSELYMGQLIVANKQHREIFVFPAGIDLSIPDISEVVSTMAPPWRR